MSSSNPGGLTVGWKQLAISSVLVSLTCLTALVVVGAIKEAEILSTVALALAVLSFSSQLVIFVIQASTSTQQLRQSEELNLQTIALIAEVRADVGGTKAIVTDHFRELLNAAISKSVPEAEKAAVVGNQPIPSSQVAELVSTLERSVSRLAPPKSDTPRPPVREPSEEDKRVIALMTTWPSEEESRQLLPIYTSLDRSTQGVLAIAASDELMSRQKASPPGLTPTTLDKPLIEAGLEELASTGNESVVRLTELGRQVGRLAMAQGPRPHYLQDVEIWSYEDESRMLKEHEASSLEEMRKLMQRNDSDKGSGASTKN